MSERAMLRCGVALVAVAVLGLLGYFWAVGLDEADQLASVIGCVVGVVGLALAAWGSFRGGRPEPQPTAGDPGSPVRQDVRADRDAYVAGRDMTVERPAQE
ncbi:hypothetical protein AB0B50_27265 [Streptomyces sp. NPDC041068]|uniref:hypothetical protein n=1 Tax=Streptomyces sp. NPDC041068 TaxID=3155130 RepID=UPI0033E39601